MRRLDIDADEAFRLYRKGLPVVRIAQQLGCDRAVVHRLLIAAGVEYRDGRLAPPDVSDEDLRALYDTTEESLASIARRLGTTKQAILGRLRRGTKLPGRRYRRPPLALPPTYRQNRGRPQEAG